MRARPLPLRLLVGSVSPPGRSRRGRCARSTRAALGAWRPRARHVPGRRVAPAASVGGGGVPFGRAQLGQRLVEAPPDVAGEREGGGPAGTVGDGREGDVRIAEEFKGPCKAGVLDLLQDGAPRGGPEADLGLAARTGEGVEDLAGAEAVHRVAANAFQCRLHRGIETAERAGREAADHAEGRNDAKACGRVWMRDALGEQLGGEEAGLPEVGADAGEGGRGRLADKGVVVGADEGHLLGD